MLPWSVTPTAGMPCRETSSASRSIFAIPSSIEYSVWLWRCTKLELAMAPDCRRWPGSGANGRKVRTKTNPYLHICMFRYVCKVTAPQLYNSPTPPHT